MMVDSIAIDGLSAGVSGFCTTRANGVSVEPYASLNLGAHVGDDLDCVKRNRAILTQHLPSEPIWLDQVHGCAVLDASVLDANTDRRADALVTTVPGQVLGILTADCMAVVLADDQARVLGLAHAGWRGLAGGVLQSTIAAMQDKTSQVGQSGEMGPWRAWISPCIGPDAFEVGSEVREAFLSIDRRLIDCFTAGIAPHKWHCNMPAIATRILLALGASSVQWCGHCTVLDEQQRFFSYRREGRTGRMATVAWLKPD